MTSTEQQPVTLVTHRGRCHCGAIQFECDAPARVVAIDCNCSMCIMRRNTHFFVHETQFRLLSGADQVATYQFNTMVAKHNFCRVCGICSFYRPRSHPSSYAITVYCLEPGTLEHFDVQSFDGTRWEESYAKAFAGNRE